ncbi:septum formation family protein [Georgenia sp. Z1344]|uniref:septum formation family protein n=1 Tax=Georgenia sp. Z1344 TaxID=3416706 RepID=UPI003CF0AF8B
MTRIQTLAATLVTLAVLSLVVTGWRTGALGPAGGVNLPDLGAYGHGPTTPNSPGAPSDPDAPGTGLPDDSRTPGDAPDPGEFDHGEGAPGIFTAAPGDCLVSSENTRVVPCDHEHSAEVYYTFTLDGDEYPGDDHIDTERCLEMFGAYVGTTPESSGYGLTSLVPSRQSWEDAGDREVICILTTREPVTGSAYQSAELVV